MIGKKKKKKKEEPASPKPRYKHLQINQIKSIAEKTKQNNKQNNNKQQQTNYNKTPKCKFFFCFLLDQTPFLAAAVPGELPPPLSNSIKELFRSSRCEL